MTMLPVLGGQTLEDDDWDLRCLVGMYILWIFCADCHYHKVSGDCQSYRAPCPKPRDP